jgi:hypothetical protein
MAWSPMSAASFALYPGVGRVLALGMLVALSCPALVGYER